MTPNYNYKKVWKYLQLFQKVKNVAEELMLHSTPEQYDVTEEIKEQLTQEELRKFIIPTILQIKKINKDNDDEINKIQIPQIYIHITPYEVRLEEQNGFMKLFTQYIAQQTPLYQKTFGEHLQAYAKNRLLNTLPQHEQWKAYKATILYVQIEDYLKAFVATQILMKEE